MNKLKEETDKTTDTLQCLLWCHDHVAGASSVNRIVLQFWYHRNVCKMTAYMVATKSGAMSQQMSKKCCYVRARDFAQC